MCKERRKQIKSRTVLHTFVSDMHHMGNGDVEIGVSTSDELPYVLGLVRQALELQLGSEGDELN